MSARDLPQRQMAKLVKQSRHEDTDPPDLGPDEMRLYSYYKPGLPAGDYEITAKQTIDALCDYGQQQLELTNCTVVQGLPQQAAQGFEVIVPRFSLDPDLINSYYPPDGHQDEGRILPHIVLNDPHYPWEILAGQTATLEGPIDDYTAKDKNGKSVALKRSLVPWIALVVFDPEELHFTSLSDLQALKLDGFSNPEDVNKQDPKGIFRMKVKDYLDVQKLPTSSRINYAAGFPSHKTGDDTDTYGMMLKDESSVDVIFPTKTLFEQLFKNSGDSADTKPGIEAYRYLSHVRQINTVGFPDAGVEEEGLFSIVLSGRTGKLDIDQPHTQVCHLVSIENVDSTLGSWLHPSNAPSDRVGMISLFSWIYTALPPNPVNFVDTVRNLVTEQQMLRIDQTVLEGIDTTDSKGHIMAERLRQGFTISRWRTQSGEETAAFNRGPLVPGPVSWSEQMNMPDCSNTSQDLQILDPQTGLLDLSYSSAWQLGKTLAISDTTFSSALMRFRSLVHNSSVHQTQLDISPMESKNETIKSITSSIASLQNLSVGDTSQPNRFRPPTSRSSAPTIQQPGLQPLFQANLTDAVLKNASAGTKIDSNGRVVGQEIYNEFNLARGNNSDWAIIHAWLCEKLCLGGIPPQYLLPEPAYLPPESLRYFHIDDNWMDALIDGALSVANHLDQDDDRTRRDIKNTFNLYLSTVVPEAGYKPQIPSYGFLIRSKVIAAMPDLRITVKWKSMTDPTSGETIVDQRAPVCRWTKWDNETLMCLLDRQPEELSTTAATGEGTGITLAQPPHQQRFSLGSYVRKGDGTSSTPDLVEFDLRRLYTTEKHPIEWPEQRMDHSLATTWLNFNTRVIDAAKMAADMTTALLFDNTSTTGEAYADNCPNSCVVGLELNDPSYYFTIIPPKDDFKPTLDSQRKRQLYVKNEKQLAADIILKKLRDAAAAEPPAPPRIIPPPPQPAPPPATSTTPAPIQRPAQTQTRLQPGLPSRLVSNWKRGGSLTTVSCFALQNIYPDYKVPPKRFSADKFSPDDYIPSGNRYYYDLIFSIRRIKDTTQQLSRIDIDIPMRYTNFDDPKKVDTKNPRPEALLESTYFGPGVKMLANQYFIPFLYYYEPTQPNTNGVMHIELVPRSGQTGYMLPMNDGRTSEVSFRLAEAAISKLEVLSIVNIEDAKGVRSTDGTKGKVLVTMTEWYKSAGSQGTIEPAPQFGQRVAVLKTGKRVVDDADWP